MKKFFLFSLFALIAPRLSMACDYSSWLYASQLKLNTSASGANVSGTVSDFPVLVRLNQSNFNFDQAKDDGSDLRFGKDEPAVNTTEYAFQIERWDKANRIAEVWVKVPQILGNNGQQAIKMYWGHSAPPTPPISDPVFSSNYAGVWHLGEGAGTTSQGFKDASPSANHGTGILLNAASSVSGVFGKGTYFNGATVSGAAQSITSINSSSLHPTGNLSIELWVKANTQGQYKRLISKAFSSGGVPWNEYDIEQSTVSNTLSFSIAVGGQGKTVSSSTPMSVGQWYHVAATYDQANMRIYVNGVLEGTFAQTGTLNNYSRPVTLGKYEHDVASNFNGTLDEVRISKTARSADWIKLAYMNQREDQKLVENSSAFQFSGGPGVLFQKYDGIADGTNFSTLVNAPQFPEDPTVTRIYPTLSWTFPPASNDPMPGAVDKFGVRMSTWVQAPVTGDYRFWMQGDDRGELWLSTDANPVNKVRIAHVPEWTPANYAGFFKNAEQKSAMIHLVEGRLYYLEALVTEETGDAFLNVNWSPPSTPPLDVPQAIPSNRLFLTPNPETDVFPSTISLYEQGTSNKKTTLGWDKTAGNEHFYLESNGIEKLKVNEDGVSTVNLKADNISTLGSINANNQGASNAGYDASSITSAEIKNTRVDNGVTQKTAEIKLNSTGLNYKTTLVASGVTTIKETKITEEGISTSGYVMTKKWKVPTPDYVFEPGYKLRSLAEVEAFVKANRHLPDVPSAKEMETEGVDIATMNMQLLKQMEHMQLYIIQQEKRIQKLELSTKPNER
jgi:hypothetical protein